MSGSIGRSQAILRMPVDNLVATMLLHDGERSEVMLFIPGGEDVAKLLCGTAQFVPVVHNGRVCLVSRTAIACLGIAPRFVPDLAEDLPLEEQPAAVKLRSGVVLEGKLRWIAQQPRLRTRDHLDGEASHFELHAADLVYYVVKAHVATVIEK